MTFVHRRPRMALVLMLALTLCAQLLPTVAISQESTGAPNVGVGSQDVVLLDEEDPQREDEGERAEVPAAKEPQAGESEETKDEAASAEEQGQGASNETVEIAVPSTAEVADATPSAEEAGGLAPSEQDDILVVQEDPQQDPSDSDELPIVQVDKNMPAQTSEEQKTQSAAKATLPKISYRVSMHGVGWQSYKANGTTAGTTSSSKYLEALRVKVTNSSGKAAKGIEYKAFIRGIGWTNWTANGAVLGKRGSNKRIEAIKIRLTGTLAKKYDVVYRVRARGYGWLGWATNGAAAGSTDKKRPLTAVKVMLQKKGVQGAAFGATPYHDGANVLVSAHVQSIGWQPTQAGEAGTTGRSLRVEAVKARLNNAVDCSGYLTYTTYVQSKGWLKWVSSGKASGTQGQSKRIEAIRFKLKGEVATQYDVYYRVSVQRLGWLGWAKNGQLAGTTDYDLRMECVQVRLMPKGTGKPSDGEASNFSASFISAMEARYRSSTGASWQGTHVNGTTCGATNGTPLQLIRASLHTTNSKLKGNLRYQTRSVGRDWSAIMSDGAVCGNKDTVIEAMRFWLEGDVERVYDIYYCVHVAGRGWLAWTTDGVDAGTGGFGAAIDAYRLQLVPKFAKGPTGLGSVFNLCYYDQGIRSSFIERYLDFAVGIANDNSHGYSQLNRWGPDYDCSSLVVASLQHAGLPTGEASYTGNMVDGLRSNGWSVMWYESMAQLQRGDILLHPQYHTEFYLGDGMNVRASMSERNSIWGTAGDQTGHEIEVVNYHENGSRGWVYVLRLQ